MSLRILSMTNYKGKLLKRGDVVEEQSVPEEYVFRWVSNGIAMLVDNQDNNNGQDTTKRKAGRPKKNKLPDIEDVNDRTV